MAFTVTEMNKLIVVQHNVLHWATRKNELYNTYRQLDPDIILLNSHGVKDCDSLSLYTYTVYKKNYANERSDGVAIAIRSTIPHKLVEDFDQILAVEVETSRGPIVLATLYLPPRRDIFPFHELYRLSRLRKPCYLMGDLNARSATLFDVIFPL